MPITNLTKASFVFALAGLLSLSACDFFEQDDYSYQDDPRLAFAQSEAETESADEGDGTVMAEVQLIGPQRDSDLQFTYTVVDSLTDADAGEEYTLSSTSGTIPAGESITQIPIEVLDNDRDDGDTSYTLELALNDTDEVEAAEVLRFYTLIIDGADEEDGGGGGS